MIEEQEFLDYDDMDDCPCNTCGMQDTCDGWEARFCCMRCRYFNEDPDCSNCDPMDI